MALTKGQLIIQSFEDIGFGSTVGASLISSGLRHLERMLGNWENERVNIGYMFSDSPLPTQDSGIESTNTDAVILNLSKRLASVYDVATSNELRSDAKTSYENLLPVTPPENYANPFMPVGAGNEYRYGYYYGPHFQRSEDVTDVRTGTSDIYMADFTNDLEGRTITGVDWMVNSTFVSITNKTLSGGEASARLTFNRQGEYLVRATATLSDEDKIVQNIVFYAHNTTPQVFTDTSI